MAKENEYTKKPRQPPAPPRLDSKGKGAAVVLILSAKSGPKSRNPVHAFRGGVGCSGFCRFLTLSQGGLWDSAENYKPLESVDFWKHCNIFLSRPTKILHTNLKFHHPTKRVGEGRSSRQMIMCATAHSSYASNWGGWGKAACSVVHPDPDGSEIIGKLGSGSVVNYGSDSGSGFESGSKLSSASN